MTNFVKHVLVGHENIQGRKYPVICTIKWDGNRLSITGVIGPFSNGNCAGGCGQIDLDDVEAAKDFDLPKFRAIWKRWHLNDCRAGTTAQEEYLRKHPITCTYPDSYYEKVCKALAKVGLNPDGDYSYGTSWLFEEVPQEVVEWLYALPETSKLPLCWQR